MISTIYRDTIRLLIKEANNRGINKDSIISIIRQDEQYVLIYEKND